MKKIINKNTLFGFVIGGIIFSTFGVAANILYNATQISYEDTNVHSALEDLYETKTELNTIKGLGDAAPENISLGKTAVVNGELVTGTLNNTTVIYLGSGTSFDVRKYYDNWSSLTTANFYIQPSGSISASGSGGWESGSVGGTQVYCNSSIALSYNASSGILSAYLTANAGGGANAKYGAKTSGTAAVKAYLVLS